MDENKQQFIARNYRHDKETEELLFDGTYLRDGMRVVFGTDVDRAETSGIQYDQIRRLCEINNRWCKISHVQTEEGGTTIAFFAEYDDGTFIKRQHRIAAAWLVKKDSIPPTIEKKPWTAKALTDEYISHMRSLGYTNVEVAYEGLGTAANEAAKIIREHYNSRMSLKKPIIADVSAEGNLVLPAHLTEENSSIWTDPTPTRTDIPVYDGPGSDAWAKNNPARGFEAPKLPEDPEVNFHSATVTNEGMVMEIDAVSKHPESILSDEEFYREGLKDLKERSERDEALLKEEHEKLSDLRSRLDGDSKDVIPNKPSFGGSWTGVRNLKRPGSGN